MLKLFCVLRLYTGDEKTRLLFYEDWVETFRELSKSLFSKDLGEGGGAGEWPLVRLRCWPHNSTNAARPVHLVPYRSKQELHFPASLRLLPAQYTKALLSGSIFYVSSISRLLPLRSNSKAWVLSCPSLLSQTRSPHLLKPSLLPTLRPSINPEPRPLQSNPPYLVTAGAVACSPGLGW